MTRICTKLVVLFLLGAAGPGFAATTDWISTHQLEAFINSKMAGGKAYATAISCRKGPKVKLTYRAFSGKPPFHRWGWIVANSNELAAKIAKMKLSTEPHLKWRIFQQSSYAKRDGMKVTCAILYR